MKESMRTQEHGIKEEDQLRLATTVKKGDVTGNYLTTCVSESGVSVHGGCIPQTVVQGILWQEVDHSSL